MKNHLLEIIRIEAAANAAQRLSLINSMKVLIDSNPELEKLIQKADSSFIRKLYHNPQDITAHRIATVIKKISK